MLPTRPAWSTASVDVGGEIGILAISCLAGLIGALAGVGGGILVIPALTFLFGVDIRLAIGASIVSVIATSSGAAAAYVRDRLTDLHIGMFLELATTSGAVIGATLAAIVTSSFLFILLGVVLLLSAVQQAFRLGEEVPPSTRPSPIAQTFRLVGTYPDARLRTDVSYVAQRVPLGFLMMGVAGVVSGLLGIGSGALKVLAMDGAMRLPMKVSSATSNFMIGVTAAASAGIYVSRGDVDPTIAAPVALGVLGGAAVGARILPRLSNRHVRMIFLPVLIVIGVQTPPRCRGSPVTPERFRLTVSAILLTGVSVAALLLGAALVGSLVVGWEGSLIGAGGATGSPTDFATLIDDLLALRPIALAQLGLVVLLLTPIARVAVSVVGFWLEGDRLYVAITALVLAILFASLFVFR